MDIFFSLSPQLFFLKGKRVTLPIPEPVGPTDRYLSDYKELPRVVASEISEMLTTYLPEQDLASWS